MSLLRCLVDFFLLVGFTAKEMSDLRFMANASSLIDIFLPASPVRSSLHLAKIPRLLNNDCASDFKRMLKSVFSF